MVLQSSARAVQMNLRSNPTSIKLGGCWLYLQVIVRQRFNLLLGHLNFSGPVFLVSTSSCEV